MNRLSYRVMLYLAGEFMAASFTVAQRSAWLESLSTFWASEAALLAWPDLLPGDLVVDGFGDAWILKGWRPGRHRRELLAVMVSERNGHEKEMDPAQVRLGKHRAIIRRAEALRATQGAA